MHLFKVADSQLPKQDPTLFERVDVKVLRPFCVNGQAQEVGSTLRIERHVAVGLQSLGKLVIS